MRPIGESGVETGLCWRDVRAAETPQTHRPTQSDTCRSHSAQRIIDRCHCDSNIDIRHAGGWDKELENTFPGKPLVRSAHMLHAWRTMADTDLDPGRKADKTLVPTHASSTRCDMNDSNEKLQAFMDTVNAFPFLHEA